MNGGIKDNMNSLIARLNEYKMNLNKKTILYWVRNWLPVTILLIIYTLVYGLSVFSRILDSAFMEIDPKSINNAIDGLTTGPNYYNMNDQYHSSFYGWSYFSLNFMIVMIAKIFTLTGEVYTNFIIRFTLFLIGLGLVAQTYYLAQLFFSRVTERNGNTSNYAVTWATLKGGRYDA